MGRSHIIRQPNAPQEAPVKAGDHFINTATKEHYLSKGTASVADWQLVGSGGSGTTDHTMLTNIGTKTHAQIDTHLNDLANPHGTNKSQLGLGSVDNTPDTNKPVSVPQQTALDLKANIASPSFTGTVGIPDGSSGTPSLNFTSDTDTGMYRSGDNELSFAAGGYDGLKVGKSTGNFSNVGMGGPASLSDAFPLLIQRATAQPINLQVSNASTDAASAVKYQLKTDAGNNTGELSLWANSALDAYGKRFVIRATDGSTGTSFVADGAANQDHKFYSGGVGIADKVATIGNTGINIHKGALNAQLTKNPLATTDYVKTNNWLLDANPTADSNETWYNKWIETKVGTDDSGFFLGDNTGGGIIALGVNISARQESSVGVLGNIQYSNELGNGTDVVTAYSVYSLDGYISLHNNSTTQYVNMASFNLGGDGNAQVDGVAGLRVGCSVDDIVTSYTGLDFFGDSTFTGTSYANVINVDMQFTDLINFTGINVAPTVTNGTNATGLNINMNNVSVSGNKKAMDITGDVSINGALTFSGALSIGQLNAFYNASAIDGGGNPLLMHGLTTMLDFTASTTTANVDAIGVNNAMLINLNANSVNTSSPFKLGAAAIALPCVVETHTGGTLDYMNMAVYALNLAGTSTGGTIDRVNCVRAEAVPNGITTINEFVAYEFNQTFGQVGTDVWGLHLVPSFAENHIGGSLNIGNASRKVTNSSVALEIESTTKAFRLPRMTTAERNALTALDGMVIYNTDNTALEYYDGTSWV